MTLPDGPFAGAAVADRTTLRFESVLDVIESWLFAEPFELQAANSSTAESTKTAMVLGAMKPDGWFTP